MTTIGNVNILTQREVTIYNFTLDAEAVMSLCKVERFGADPNGVNRRYDDRHALEIAAAMLDPNMLWPEPILGDLTGTWTHDSEDRKLCTESGYISIDDGQHRWAALSVLNPVERAKLQFTVQATMGLSFEQRLRVFRAQSNRKAIDPRLDMAQRHRLGDWKNPVDSEAYELVLKLSADITSPLRGMILLNEQEKRPYEGKHRPVGINSKGLHSTLRSVLGGSSPLSALSSQERARVVQDMIRLAAAVWPQEWSSDDHALTTARGINAILMLIVSSPNFRGAIGDNFSQESLERGLSLAKSFKWAAAGLRNISAREIVNRLDQSIGRTKRQMAKAA